MFPGSKVVCSTASCIFIIHAIVDLILTFLVNLVLISLVGDAFNGGCRCLSYLSLLLGVIIGVSNIRLL